MSHITLIVDDLERSTRMLEYVLDAEEVYSSGEKPRSLSPEKFFLIGGTWVALMQGVSSGGRTYEHIAFRIAEEDYDACLARIDELSLETREDRARILGEGRSIYFYDYDGHLFELHAGTLEERLRAYQEPDVMHQ